MGAVFATDVSLSLPALYAFIGGFGAQEKTIAELKGEFALELVLIRHPLRSSVHHITLTTPCRRRTGFRKIVLVASSVSQT